MTKEFLELLLLLVLLALVDDLSNAFGSECVEYLGVRGIPLQWLKSAFLMHHHHQTQLKKVY